MKINKTEKVLLVVLGILLIITGYYKFIFLKQRDKISQLQSQKNDYEQKVRNETMFAGSLDKRKLDIKILNSKIQDKTLRLFPSTIEEEKIIVDLDNILNQSNLDSATIAFSDITMQPIDTKNSNTKKDAQNPLKDLVDQYNGINVSNSNTQGNNLNNNGNNVSKVANSTNNTSNNANNKNTVTTENMAVNINFKGSYDTVLNFLKNLENYNKKIIISNINLAQDASKAVSGTATLEFYAVPKITDEDKDFLKWNYNNYYGKDNPFDGIIAQGDQNISSSTIEEAVKPNSEPNYDFLMAVRSINSDLPTIMLGKAKDSKKNTYVYADNPGVENVEIVFTEKYGKYYYKYKTSKDTYPIQYNADGMEFTPNDNNINLKIYSNKRLGSDDLSGANIKVYNKTDKKVEISIDSDDNLRPRISITGEGGEVHVKRN